MADRNHLDLDNYLPYLVNRVGFALVENFTAGALKGSGVSIDMWRVLAALSNNGGAAPGRPLRHDLDRRLDHVAAGQPAGAASGW